MRETKELGKGQKGITLVALVITIIVLLILAGVSIAMLIGSNGILTQAQAAKKNTQIAKEDEENRLASNNNYINEQLGNAGAGKVVKETKKDNYVDRNGDKATVPQGFTASKIAEEQTIANGLVIYDIPESEIENVDWTTKNEDGAYNVQTKYNQFVWIPVANETIYQRDFSYPSYYYINNSWTSSDITPENSTFTDTGYLPTEIAPNSETDSAETSETAERTAVLKYNGFYIARYEAGIDGSDVVSKQNVTVYTDKTQEEFKAIGKTMYGDGNQYVKSAMCSGVQWDMVMKFVDGKKDASSNNNIDSIFDVRIHNSTRHTGSKKESGKNIIDKVQNVYDLEGNCYEYVAEKNNTINSFVRRGGLYRFYRDDRASLRYSTKGVASNDLTFRAVLYLK